MEYIGIRICPICRTTGAKRLIERGREPDYVLYRCFFCGGDFAETELYVDYQEEYRMGELGLKRLGAPGRQLNEAKVFAHYTQALHFLKKFPPGARLLDVGRGTKVFAKLAEEAGFKVYCLDSIPEATTYGKEVFGLKNSVTGTLDDMPPDWHSFDFVTCFEVLEHVSEPRQLSEKMYHLLAPGGYLVVSAPNRNRLSVKLGRRDAHDYPPNHLTRWSKEVLSFLLRDVGFQNVIVKTDGIERRDLTAIFLPNRLNTVIVRRKVTSLNSRGQNKREFFVHSPLWRFIQVTGDVVASALRTTVGRCYGVFLIGFAQKTIRAI